MPRHLADDVATYIGHFRAEHAKLAMLADDLHKRILTVTILSALAEGRFPNERNSGAQFIQFIEQYSAWSDATSISVTLLEMAENSAPRLSASIMSEITRRNAAWRVRNTVALDPQATDILPRTATSFDRERVDQFKHAALLWIYRNKLVHEYRKPGHGMDSPTAKFPFYHGMTHLDDGKRETVELVYPVKWLLGLVPPALDALECHYLDSGANPYNSYSFGSPWRR